MPPPRSRAGPPASSLLVFGTVLVGQACLGWFNDLVDRRRDARHHAAGKPVADGRLDPGTVWFVLAIGVFVVVPLSIANGVYAGAAYLISLGVAVLGTWIWIRQGLLLLGAVGGVVRPAAGVPVLRRLGRPGQR